MNLLPGSTAVTTKSLLKLNDALAELDQEEPWPGT